MGRKWHEAWPTTPSAEARLLSKRSSDEIEVLLGYSAGPEMVHRDNMVLLPN